MFRKILCPVDGTDHASRALKVAVDLSARFGAALTICTVQAAAAGAGGSHVPGDHAGEILERAASQSRALSHGSAATELVMAMDVAPAILQIAEAGRYDCIVMGSGRWRGATRTELGSVAADVSRRAHCSVMVAR